jgi:hypothetical protein
MHTSITALNFCDGFEVGETVRHSGPSHDQMSSCNCVKHSLLPQSIKCMCTCIQATNANL